MKKFLLLLALFFIASLDLYPQFWVDIPEYDDFILQKIVTSDIKYKNLHSTFLKSKDFNIRYYKSKNSSKFDINTNIDTLPYHKLRFLKYEFFARKGYIFFEACLRNHFCMTDWFTPIYWDSTYKIYVNKQEENFLTRVAARQKELLKQNVILQNNIPVANKNNIVNLDFFKRNDQDFENLINYGFIINNEVISDIYQAYEYHHYDNVPIFITTDSYLSLMYDYFNKVLTTNEGYIYINKLQRICLSLYNENQKYTFSKDSLTREAAKFNTSFFKIGLCLIDSNFSKNNPLNSFEKEILSDIYDCQKINEKDPKLFNMRIDYTLFKPRGKYTKLESLSQYFRLFKWLSNVAFPLDNDMALLCQIINAHSIENIKQKNISLKSDFTEFIESIKYFVGIESNYSTNDIINYLSTDQNSFNPDSNKHNLIANTRKYLANKNMKILQGSGLVDQQLRCFFIPEAYTPDAEIFGKLVNMQNTERRAFPKSLDVFAATGSKQAEDILIGFYKEDKNWKNYYPILKSLQNDFSRYDFKSNLYNFWLYSLSGSTGFEENYPFYMKNPNWAKKNLNTAQGSWMQLKNLTLLYAFENYAAEAGDQEPDVPYSIAIGCVEPNLKLWTNVLELLSESYIKFKELKMLDSTLIANYDSLYNLGSKLKYLAESQTNNHVLIESELSFFNYFWLNYSSLTYDLRDFKIKDEQFEGLESFITVTDVFTSNTSCLQVGISGVNQIFVIAPINNKLYLCSGFIYRFNEFVNNADKRMTCEEFRKICSEDIYSLKTQEWLKKYYINKDFEVNNKNTYIPNRFDLQKYFDNAY